MQTYVPAFNIEVQGKSLATAVLKDVLSVTVAESRNTYAISEITLNNGSGTGNFKYSDAELFVLGAQVIIYMGYQRESINTMCTGIITSLAPRFLKSESSILVVTVTGAKRRKHSLGIKNNMLSLNYGKSLVEFNPVNSYAHRERNSKTSVIAGRGSAIGLPDLKPGALITIDGLGQAFNGEYMVESTKHVVDAGGYGTEFTSVRQARMPREKSRG